MSTWEVADAHLERRLRRWGIPAAVAVAWLLVKTGPGHFLLRTFLSMWVHEIGHAATAWLCGFPAFPGPWLTPTAAERSWAFALLVFGALGYATLRVSRWFGALVVLQVLCTLQPPDRARQLICFMGDGGALVLGTALMLTLYAPEGSKLRRDWLRWGLLAIGAASFTDVFEQWWSARSDPDRIPFGMNEGVGPSDPSVLSDRFGWSADRLVQAYVALGVACLLVLAAAYLRGLRQPVGDRG